MTTLVRTRHPLDTLSMNTQPQRRRSKRNEPYDESDGDFKYTRPSKRTRTTQSAPEPEAPIAPAPTSAPTRTRTRQKPVVEEDEGSPPAKKPQRRKMNFATPKRDENSITVPKRTTRRTTRASLEKAREEEQDDSVEMVGASSSANDITRTPEDTSKNSTKIALPFSDTPVINRNKELRKKGTGGRRSSLGLRGRRASSLIDNGHSAIPHQQVETSQFYKHIEAEGLSEPRRMKQLLTWCGERALGEKPSHNIEDSAAVLAARHIQEQLLKDFSNRSEMSDWFNREDTGRTVVVKVPNPLNIHNAARIKELEERIERLKAEKAQWKSITQPPPLLPIPAADAPLDPSLLDAEGASILSALQSTSSGLIPSTSNRLKAIQQNLEFQVDVFAHGIHKLDQARQEMDSVASKVLAQSAVQLEEREKEEKESAGTRDVPIQEVLRALSRIMPEGRR